MIDFFENKRLRSRPTITITIWQRQTVHTPMSDRLEIHTLGGLRIVLNGTAVTGLASRKAEALLLYLACNPQPHARETLATMFWDDAPHQRSLANLSVLLSSLRKTMGIFLESSRHTVQIANRENIWLDIEAIVNAIERAPTSSSLSRSTAVPIGNIVPLVQGSFLSGFFISQASDFSEWVVIEQERLLQIILNGLSSLLDFYIQRRQLTEGINLGTKLVSLDPLREESHRQLIQLYAENGQRTAALEQYQSCVAILDEELGVTPDNETTDLMLKVRAGALNNTTTTSRISPVTPQSPVEKHNIPTDMTTFVGREAELQQIETRLNDPNCRLLSILGPGGVGKTRLTIAALRQQIDQYLDGVWLISLASVASSAFLETAVADVIGFSFSNDQDPRIALLNYLAPKEMLLFFDNFESILDENSVQFLNQLILQAPEIQILVSSRQRLQLQAEWLIEVEGLSFPADDQTDPKQFGAVQLFLQRARQLAPSFNDDKANLTGVAQITRLLVGMPLGIELAAANCRYYSPKEIASGIQEGLDFLQTNLRDLPERHRSLRAVIDRSWNGLSDEEQWAFMGLSVFQGQFSQSAALYVLKTKAPILHSMVDKSLLMLKGNGRFQLHSLLKQYAEEKLANHPQKAAQARGRHGVFFARLLHSWQSGIKGGQQADALEAIQQDIENIRLGWHYAQSLTSSTPQILNNLGNSIETLFHFYNMRSWLREGVDVFQQGMQWLDSPKNNQEKNLRARIQSRYGWFAFLLGEQAAGQQALEESLAILKGTEFVEDVIFCLNYLGATSFYQQRSDEAKMYLNESLALATEHGDAYGEAIGHNIMGVLHLELSLYDLADAYLRESLAIKGRIGDVWGRAFSLERLGQVDRINGRLDAAEAHLQESLTLRRALGDPRGEALCLEQLGDLAHQRGDWETAVSLYQDCLAIFEDIGDAQAINKVKNKLVA